MLDINVVSLFTGAGAMDLGFQAAGARIVFTADNMPEACQTLRHNFPDTLVFGPPQYSGDVRELDRAAVFEISGLQMGDVDILVAGPPCQPFSVAAAQRFLKEDPRFKRKGYECEEKGSLIFEALRLILEIRPRAFLIENVPGLVTIDGGRSIRMVCNSLSEAGYRVTGPMILNALWYGLPQHRRRAFIVGCLGDKDFATPDPEAYLSSRHHSASRPCTVAEALVGFNYSLPNSDIRSHRASSVERYKQLSYGERDLLGRVDRLDPLKPSKTVIAGGCSGGGRSHLHPFVARTLSVRESARLQTFPDHFEFFGKIGRQFTQVGNAVPPLLAEIMAKEMLHRFFDRPVQPSLNFRVKSTAAIEAATRLREWSISEHPDMLYDDISIPTCEFQTLLPV